MATYDVAALEKLVEQFQKIPSIGRKTAQRMAFHVLDLPDNEAKEFADAIMEAIRNLVQYYAYLETQNEQQ